MTRRDCVRLLSGTAVAVFSPATASINYQSVHARYRADATISFLGIPIFSRNGVGSGYAVFEEERGDGERTLGLQFAGGSWPERAAGLNKLGMIQETMHETAGSLDDATYFGFMTSAPEQNLEEARESLKKNPGKTIPFAAVEGLQKPASYSFRQVHFDQPADASWSTWQQLLPRVYEQFAGATAKAHRKALTGQGPFLYCLQQILNSREKRHRTHFLYGQKAYELHTERAPDTKMRDKLARKGLCSADAPLDRLQGEIHGAAKGTVTKFRLWVVAGAPLPLRIELQPRSFLSLAFEKDHTLEKPAISFLLRSPAGGKKTA